MLPLVPALGVPVAILTAPLELLCVFPLCIVTVPLCSDVSVYPLVALPDCKTTLPDPEDVVDPEPPFALCSVNDPVTIP